MTCLCPACSDSPSPTYSESWRAETEARWVVRLPTLEQRREYLALVRKERDAQAAQVLEAQVLELWHAARSVTPA